MTERVQRSGSSSVTALVRRACPPPLSSGCERSQLRGEMEHLSHEAAVTRYMTPRAVLDRERTDRRFHITLCVVAAVSLLLCGSILLLL